MPGPSLALAAAPSRTSLFARGGALCLVLVLAACASRTPAPVSERPPPPPRATVAPPPPPPAREVQPEPDWRPQTYTVKKGDTLHAIALDHGLDYRELATWNGIENPNLIRVGQVLRLSAPGDVVPGTAVAGAGVVTAPLKPPPPVVPGDARPVPSPSAQPLAMPGPRNAENYKSAPKAIKEPYTEQALREVQRAQAAPPPAAVAVAPPAAVPPVAAAPSAPATAPPPTAAPPAVAEPRPAPAPAPAPAESAAAKPGPAAAAVDSGVDWVWPATGKVVTGFSDTANLKGIDIAGKAGQPVLASAAGKVVYAGTGLRGYGKLVIVKHNADFLSAYAHNKEILVKEGQQVTKGQKIAEMGNTDSDQVKLHFEIRQRGKPVDPLRFLPPG
jgi:lipoprotein NlpD